MRYVKIGCDTAIMATQPITRGPTARTVAANLRRLMKSRSLTSEELSAALGEIRCPILATGITKIMQGDRRVDVDDLMALAIALRVNPSTLLLPTSTDRQQRCDVTGASGLEPHVLWDWADGRAPLFDPDDDEADLDFQVFARPRGRRVMRNLPGRDFQKKEKKEGRKLSDLFLTSTSPRRSSGRNSSCTARCPTQTLHGMRRSKSMASVRKRPDGKYRARYRDPGGREHAKHFTKKSDAQRWLDEATAALVTGRYVDPRAGRRFCFADYASGWERGLVQADGTARIVDNALRLHLVATAARRAATRGHPAK